MVHTIPSSTIIVIHSEAYLNITGRHQSFEHAQKTMPVECDSSSINHWQRLSNFFSLFFIILFLTVSKVMEQNKKKQVHLFLGYGVFALLFLIAEACQEINGPFEDITCFIAVVILFLLI